MLQRLVCVLLFGSGFSALTYQVVWMREFRLVFGASTASTAAVSALFMAGLGVGGWFIGPRADREARPLGLYGRLEIAIAILAVFSPVLLYLTRHAYLASGGMMVLGTFGATLARLLLAAIVVGIPAFLMGGTLPAVVRAVTRQSDSARRSLGVLYGVNTLGSLTGVVLTTFFLMEHYGARATLYIGAAVNIVVALAALHLSRQAVTAESDPAGNDAATGGGTATGRTYATVDPNAKTEIITPVRDVRAGEPVAAALPCRLALVTAGVVGFAFFLMELVWYRMLAPILGGSTYTFGLILSVALAGIGIGGAAYPLLMKTRTPSAVLLAGTCLLEALFMMIPYAVGDWVMAVTAQLMSFKALGFGGLVGAWFLVAILIVFPAAFISGIQFPLLIALLGRGARNIGRQTGRAYAFNTAGAILGSLAGGFGLMPWLTAPGCWILSGLILTVVGIAIAVSAYRKESAAAPAGTVISGNADSARTAAAAEAAGTGVVPAGAHRISGLLFMGIVAILLAACFTAEGPTAAWRHSPVGAGRVAIFPSMEQVKFQFNFRRNSTIWEAEGVESSVGILDDDGYSFFVNGKSDGNVIGDRGTQILCGLIGAALHPSPRTSLVVGLGTGCTAGWLSEVRTMERVDVVELEPAILHMAELCSDANAGVMDKIRNGKAVRIIFNDAREVLNTTPDRYDLIASEPSNPYRAGIASLFTREFYEEVRSRLNPGGLFVSWCQAYEIDTETVFRILATLKTVFPYVECWNSQMADLVFVASMEPIHPDPALLARRLDTAPFPDAMRIGWAMSGLEGFLSRFIATDALIDQIVAAKDLGINTDDLMKVEYDYARTVGRLTRFSMTDLRLSAVKRGQGTPPWQPAGADDEMTAMSRALCYVVEGMAPIAGTDFPAGLRDRLQAVEHWRSGNYAAALQIPFNPVRPPHRLERLARAECLAWNGDNAALDQIAGFEDWWPASAAFVRARLAVFTRDWETATTELERGYAILREQPWEVKVALDQSFKIA